MIASVCIGTHNAEKFIVETLNSVKDQTLKDIECIIVDDHSTDRTCEIIYNEFCSKDPRFKLFVNCTDLQRPYVDAMNLSYQYASGKYLVRLDHDDVLYPDNIEYQVDYLEKHPEIGATCMNNWMCNTDTNGNIIKDTELKDIPLIEYLKNNVKKSQSHEGIDEFNNFNTFSIGENPAVWNNVGSCIRKSVIETYNLKYEEFIQGDYVHNIKLSSLVRMFKH